MLASLILKPEAEVGEVAIQFHCTSGVFECHTRVSVVLDNLFENELNGSEREATRVPVPGNIECSTGFSKN